MGPGVVVVGASLAGAKAVETLRTEGYDEPVVLVGAEEERPYERPPLSKAYLLGDADRDSIYVHPEGWYAEHDVDLRLGVTATALDLGARTVTLEDGTVLPYRDLLLTTGSRPRRLPVPGGDLDGVLTLRSVGDSEALRSAFVPGAHVVVVGGGWIGLETTAAARHYGADVTIVEPQPTPLYAVLGPEMGALFADLHRDHGVDLRLGTGVSEIRGDGGRAVGVVTSSGDVLDADAVVVGVGIQPNVELAADAGLEVDNGVLVDDLLRTVDPNVYAAGDVANAWNPLLEQRVRVEHWANALNGGPAAARSILGRGQPYDRVPYFYSDQYDLGMEYSGLTRPGEYDEVVIRGDRERRELVAFWLREGRVLAGMNVNVWDANEHVQRLIRSREPVDRRRLADVDVPLSEIGRSDSD